LGGAGFFEEFLRLVPGILRILLLDIPLGGGVDILESLGNLHAALDLLHEVVQLKLALVDVPQLLADHLPDFEVNLALHTVHEVLEAHEVLVEVFGVHPDELEVVDEVCDRFLEAVEAGVLLVGVGVDGVEVAFQGADKVLVLLDFDVLTVEFVLGFAVGDQDFVVAFFGGVVYGVGDGFFEYFDSLIVY
jgi:hypothetical protein